jgi:hypothetical protein
MATGMPLQAAQSAAVGGLPAARQAQLVVAGTNLCLGVSFCMGNSYPFFGGERGGRGPDFVMGLEGSSSRAGGAGRRL